MAQIKMQVVRFLHSTSTSGPNADEEGCGRHNAIKVRMDPHCS